MGLTCYDVGSLPFLGDFEKYLEGATNYPASPSSQSYGSSKYFESKVVESFLEKKRVGVEIPNYPQFRDMNRMFLELIEGVEKGKSGYAESGILSIRAEKTTIPEVAVIKNNSREIHEKTGQPFKVKICVTGPHTLSCLFVHRDKGIFNRLEKIIARIVENNILNDKHGSVKLVAVEEPTFGLLDDPLVDYGTEGRENLRRAWESIFQKIVSKGAHSCLHLHGTTDGLFWGVKSLNVVESHVGDIIYHSQKTKKSLESTDKFLKASICVTDFDKLIRQSLTLRPQQKPINERVAEVWKDIASSKLDPTIFLESVEVMKKRLIKIINQFGTDRVPYAGPECGLKSFPTYQSALECLKRASKTTKT